MVAGRVQRLGVAGLFIGLFFRPGRSKTSIATSGRAKNTTNDLFQPRSGEGSGGTNFGAVVERPKWDVSKLKCGRPQSEKFIAFEKRSARTLALDPTRISAIREWLFLQRQRRHNWGGGPPLPLVPHGAKWSPVGSDPPWAFRFFRKSGSTSYIVVFFGQTDNGI